MVWAAIGAAAVTTIGGAVLNKKKGGGSSSGGGSSGGGFSGLLSDYMTAKQGQEMATARDKAVAMADPFAGSRNLANQQLQNLMRDPNAITQDPSYQFAVQQGGQVLDRSLAARHMSVSGGALQELTQWGQGLASQQYNQRLQTLANMASQGASPTAAADAELKGTQYSQGLMGAAAAGGLQSLSGGGGGGSMFGAVGDAIGGMFGGGSSGGGDVNMAGFQNSNYQPNYFGGTPTGGSLDYSTSFGTTPDSSGASLSGTGIMSGLY